MLERVVRSSAILVLLGTLASAQPPLVSSRTAVAAVPAARLGHALVQGLTRGEVLLFGGSVFSHRFFADLWAWDGQRWTRLAESGPPAREDAVLVHDPVRRRVVLYGGAGRGPAGPMLFTDTWEWDGTRWSEISGSSPGPRQHAAGGFDPERQRVLLFGGHDHEWLADTWEWDGERWTLCAADGPPERTPVGFAYEPVSAAVLGLLADSTALDERGALPTQLFRRGRTSWTPIPSSTLTIPAPAPFFALDGGRFFTFDGGGFRGAGGEVATFQWDGKSWSRTTGGPSARIGAAAAYDPARERVVLFGGGTLNPERTLGDTWEWDGARWTRLLP